MNFTKENLVDEIIEIITDEGAMLEFANGHKDGVRPAIFKFINKFFRAIKYDIDFDLEEYAAELMNCGSVYFTDTAACAAYEIHMFLMDIEYNIKQERKKDTAYPSSDSVIICTCGKCDNRK